LEVLIVRVAPFEVSPLRKETGFGENEALAPVGSTVVTDKVALNAPDYPGPDPRLTVTA
jgi:hypothetical protein